MVINDNETKLIGNYFQIFLNTRISPQSVN